MKYQINGNEVQFIEITLQPGEAVISETGTLMSMDAGIRMEPIMDTENKGSILSSLFQAGKRMATGESAFLSKYKNISQSVQTVCIAPESAGKVIAIDSKKIICQKGAFIVGAAPLSIGIEITKKWGAGLFGKEGFVLQRIESENQIFLIASGSIIERELKAGEVIRMEPGCVVAFEPSVQFSVVVSEFKNQIIGNSGIFYTTLTGPGKVWIQSHPESKFWEKVMKLIPPTSGT